MNSRLTGATAETIEMAHETLTVTWCERQRLLWALLAEAKRCAIDGDVESVKFLVDLIDRVEALEDDERLTPAALCLN